MTPKILIEDSKMKIEIDDEMMDKILCVRLFKDYDSLKSDIRNLKSTEDLKPYQKEDLKAHKKYKKAIATLLEYYVGSHWESEYENFIASS
jgi:hypothetical protein